MDNQPNRQKINIVQTFHYNGAYSFGRHLYHNIKNPTNFQVLECLDGVVDKSKKGGTVVFSTDLPLTNDVLKDFMEQKWLLLKQDFAPKRKMGKIILNDALRGWTIDTLLKGRYALRNGAVFGENSLFITVIGIDTTTLLALAAELCDLFRQKAVLVKDFTTKNIHFIEGSNT